MCYCRPAAYFSEVGVHDLGRKQSGDRPLKVNPVFASWCLEGRDLEQGYLKSLHNRELRSYPQISNHILVWQILFPFQTIFSFNVSFRGLCVSWTIGRILLLYIVHSQIPTKTRVVLRSSKNCFCWFLFGSKALNRLQTFFCDLHAPWQL